jgi:rod shape-determining protein MreD
MINRVLPITFLILLSLLFMVLQSTFLSPTHFGRAFYPDLNLVLIVFLGLFADLRRGAIIALGNGYIMDVLSGYVIGIHSLSRLSVFVILKGISQHVYSQSRITQAIAILFATLFLWSFICISLRLKADLEFGISLGDVMTQGVVNTVVGLPIFWIIKGLYAKIQE